MPPVFGYRPSDDTLKALGAKLEVDAWERRRLRKKQWYIDHGESPEDADDKATNDIRREIRG